MPPTWNSFIFPKSCWLRICWFFISCKKHSLQKSYIKTSPQKITSPQKNQDLFERPISFTPMTRLRFFVGNPGFRTRLFNWSVLPSSRQFFPKKMGNSREKTLPETNIALENRPSQKESSIPTIHFQVLWLMISRLGPVSTWFFLQLGRRFQHDSYSWYFMTSQLPCDQLGKIWSINSFKNGPVLQETSPLWKKWAQSPFYSWFLLVFVRSWGP